MKPKLVLGIVALFATSAVFGACSKSDSDSNEAAEDVVVVEDDTEEMSEGDDMEMSCTATGAASGDVTAEFAETSVTMLDENEDTGVPYEYTWEQGGVTYHLYGAGDSLTPAEIQIDGPNETYVVNAEESSGTVGIFDNGAQISTAVPGSAGQVVLNVEVSC